MSTQPAYPLSARYPRLAALMAWQGCLSASEVECALRAMRNGQAHAGEAVAHYGGTRSLFIDSLRSRRNPYVRERVLDRVEA